MKIKKAIFPVGGLGTRFLPATKSMPKEMLPIVDKPLIQYAVEEAADAGIEQFIFVTSRGKSAIENHFDHSFELENNLDLAIKIETFNNTLVRKGERIMNTTKHVQDLLKWFDDKFAKEKEKRSSEKGKAAIDAKKADLYKFFSKENKKNLTLMFDLMNAIVDAKLIIINKLDKVKQIDTFVRTRNGFKVTGSEGFVAIDNNGGAVKLVDRLEFSMNNFSKDVIKGWER